MEDVFTWEDYKKEDDLFNLVRTLKNALNLELVTDNKTFFALRSGKEFPVWVYSKKNLTDEQLDYVASRLKEFLLDDRSVQFTLREDLYKKVADKYGDLVVNDFFKEKGSYLTMCSYTCTNPVEVKVKKGSNVVLRKPRLDDYQTLVKFQFGDAEDTLTSSSFSKFTLKDAEEKASKFLKKDNFYLLEVDGEVVSQACLNNEDDDTCKVCAVYTDKDHRGYGYAAYLVYLLTKKVTDKKKRAVLYADFDYPSSNRCYKKVGYRENGCLYLVRLGRKKKIDFYR